ncbi:uncharacterized protein KRP23_4593 [Phytophthora ramorum]|uniref:uncharacterized protein n=1 Tax=Phytophthora ramorum TaxID=164328 RepID=UPI0030AAEDA5|nr:hypothetical protein KRP23_4593 [Phytophthora ramorum]
MVRVVSCRFTRLSCSEDDHPLFRRYYARSNRERGVKLLRCFPHCCPEHVQRCYCGTSIHVQLTFAAELPAASQANLFVCARFEPSRVVPLWPAQIAATPGFEGEDEPNQESERKLQPGEVVPLPSSLVATGKRQAKQTQWIRADREGEVKQKALPKNAALYVLNNHRFPKWLYSYDSSITRTQREMTHHLVVYVFQLRGTSSQPGEVDATVLARHESPGFSLISYRRSGNNSRDAGCDLPALETASDSAFAAVAADTPDVAASTSGDMEIDSCGRQPAGPLPDPSSFNLESKVEDAPEDQRACATTQAGNANHNADSMDSDLVFWVYDARARHSGLVEKAKHLAILWRFLSCVSLSDVGVTGGSLDGQIRSHWRRAAGALRASPGSRTPQLEGVMSSFLLGLCRSTPPFPHEQWPSREQTVTQSAVHLLLRALSSRATQYALQSAFAVGSERIVDKQELRQRFIALVLDLYDVLGDVLQLGSPVETVEGLFRAFGAQVQEIMFVRDTNQSESPSGGSSGLDTSWSRRWLLEPGSIHVASIPQEPSLSAEPSLVELSRWIHELACIDIAVQDGGSRLSVRSVLPMVNGVEPTDLVLDGRLRGFRATPGGISARLPTSGGWSIGDYAARFSHRTHTLEVDLYACRQSSLDTHSSGRTRGGHDRSKRSLGTVAQRVSMTFVLEEHLDERGSSTSVDPRDRFLFFRGVVAHAVHDDTRPQSPWSPQPKLAGLSVESRSVVFRELQWVPQLEVQGGYVAVPP